MEDEGDDGPDGLLLEVMGEGDDKFEELAIVDDADDGRFSFRFLEIGQEYLHQIAEHGCDADLPITRRVPLRPPDSLATPPGCSLAPL